ncbi:MAG: hypothetical protein MJE63_08330 [Proteobacteria bacterium]|nr:hypothetical protein [Pseudomonadota bacterium]
MAAKKEWGGECVEPMVLLKWLIWKDFLFVANFYSFSLSNHPAATQERPTVCNLLQSRFDESCAY